MDFFSSVLDSLINLVDTVGLGWRATLGFFAGLVPAIAISAFVPLFPWVCVLAVLAFLVPFGLGLVWEFTARVSGLND